MKFRLITCLLLLINLACYANVNYHSADSTIHKKIKHAQRKIVYHITYPRESIKGYKPEFDNCFYTNRFTAAQRLKKYPFSVATKILAISYVGLPKNPNIIIDSAGFPKTSEEPDSIGGIIIENGHLRYDNVKQAKVLTREQLEKFSDIIFNYGYSGMKNYLITALPGCFEPRNSIVFLDKNDNVIDHLDICFACKASESGSEQINVGTDCKQKYDMLKAFFINVGVPYGTRKYDQ
ncbi:MULTISPECIES: hypothetical protein [Mucilaginibacter]|uniref:Uncharacterized protein n=1 Tax=Mucilaginibacter rubeus TaxID=2027860 RepID=A0A5C1HZ63_9SPHI|nr:MULTISPECIES: hypothetical protein [Mucilaginibacter]QEM11112.1 hypothetical protein DEO27_014130 [Mucilaginibacter rubeus]